MTLKLKFLGGGRGPNHRCVHGKISMSKKAGGDSSKEQSRTGDGTTNGNQASQLDAGKLIGKLQKLVLAPIREVPTSFFPQFFARKWQDVFPTTDVSEDGTLWFKRLQKPKSCENLNRISKKETPSAVAAYRNNNVNNGKEIDGESMGVLLVSTDEDFNDAEDESNAVDDDINERPPPRHKHGKRRKHKRCRASALRVDFPHFGDASLTCSMSRPVLG